MADVVMFVFDTTTGALWAEEVARAAGLPVEAVPAPAESDAKCDLALTSFRLHGTALAEAWRGEGIPFRPWPSGA